MAEGKLSDRLAIVSVIDPDVYASGTHLGDAIDMAFHRQIMVVVMAGTMSVNDTLDCILTESATSGGTYTQISGKSMTQFTNAGSDDDKQAVINLKSEEMGAGMRYVKVSLRIVGSTDAGVLTLAGRSRYTTASATTTYGDLASVDEIVA